MTETRIENKEIEFVSEEQQFEDALCSGSTSSLKRISCLSHTLQLVMGTFDKYRNNNPRLWFSEVVKDAKKNRGKIQQIHNSLVLLNSMVKNLFQIVQLDGLQLTYY